MNIILSKIQNQYAVLCFVNNIVIYNSKKLGSFHMKLTEKRPKCSRTPPVLIKFGTHVGPVLKFTFVNSQTCD